MRLVLSSLILLLPSFVWALAFSDILGQTAIGPLLNDDQSSKYTPAVGINSINNGLDLGGQKNLSATNRNSYIIGLDVNGNNTTLSLPFQDPKESVESRVDSDLFNMSTSIRLSDGVRAELSYNYVKGFLQEENQKEAVQKIIFPELGFERISASLYFLDNEKHSSFLFSPVMYKRPEISETSSWIYAVDLSRHKFLGLGTVQEYESFNKNSDISEATVYNLSGGIVYSQSSFFDNWFLGGAAGLYLGLDHIKKHYLSSEQRTENKFATAALLNLSTGYTWTSLTSGIYIEYRSFSVQIDEFSIGNNLGNTGWYFTYAF